MGKNVRNNYSDNGMTRRNWKVKMMKKKHDRIRNFEGCNARKQAENPQ